MNIIHWLFPSVGASAAAASRPGAVQSVAQQKISELDAFLQENDGLIQSFAKKSFTRLTQPEEQKFLDTVFDFRRSLAKVRAIQERIRKTQSLPDPSNAAFAQEGRKQIDALSSEAGTICQELLARKQELILTMNLLMAIIDAKNQGKNTDALLQVGSYAIRHHESFSRGAMTFIPLTDAPPPSQPTKFDLVKCYYDGHDLLKKEGSFLIADLRGLSAEERSRFDQVPQQKIAALLALHPTGELVRAKLEGTNLVPDPSGPIVLFKEAVADTFHEKLDFGSRQRLVEETHWLAPNHVSRHKKEHLDIEHAKWTPDRERTALVDCAESRLFIQALSEKLLEGKWEIKFEKLLHILDHLDAIWVNDLARLPGSYRDDPHYITLRALFEQMRPDLTNLIMIPEAVSQSFPALRFSTQEKHRSVLENDMIGIIESYYRGNEDTDLASLFDLTPAEKARFAPFLASVNEFRNQTIKWVHALREASTKNEAAVIQALNQLLDEFSELLEKHAEIICLANSPIIQRELYRRMDPRMEQIFLIKQLPNSQLSPAEKSEAIERILTNLSVEERALFEKKYTFVHALIHDSSSLLNNTIPALASGLASYAAGSSDYWNMRQCLEKYQRLFLHCLAHQTQTSFALLGKHGYQDVIDRFFQPAAAAAASI